MSQQLMVKKYFNKENYVKYLKNDDKTFRINILDSSGDGNYFEILKNQLKEANHLVFVVDINYGSTSELKELFESLKLTENKTTKILLGNKTDFEKNKEYLNEKINTYKQFSKEYMKAEFMECSALTGFNLEKVFESIYDKTFERKKPKKTKNKSPKFDDFGDYETGNKKREFLNPFLIKKTPPKSSNKKDGLVRKLSFHKDIDDDIFEQNISKKVSLKDFIKTVSNEDLKKPKDDTPSLLRRKSSNLISFFKKP
jgi:hypothetical protein